MKSKFPPMRKCDHGVPKIMCDICKPLPTNWKGGDANAKHEQEHHIYIYILILGIIVCILNAITMVGVWTLFPRVERLEAITQPAVKDSPTTPAE
jgi:hypothetical protein